MNRKSLFPGTGLLAARTPWLLLATATALFPLTGVEHPFPAVCGALALAMVGIVLRRWILFAIAGGMALVVSLVAQTSDFYYWIKELARRFFA